MWYSNTVQKTKMENIKYGSDNSRNNNGIILYMETGKFQHRF